MDKKLVFTFIDTINRTRFNTRLVFNIDAWFSNYICDLYSPDVDN